ncbi:MAG: RNA polymerase sigma-70 factor [Flavobacteriales bacterium]
MHLDTKEQWSAIQQGSVKAFEVLFKMLYAPLCRHAFLILKDEVEAEEVVQEVFYQVWNKKHSLRIHESLKAYLYRAVHNDCANRLKHLKVKEKYANELRYQDQDSDSSSDVEEEELSLRIQQALDALPDQCGVVFKLSRFEQLKYAEIALRLNISVKTVENHMGKALRILREKLKEYIHLITLFMLLK